MIHAKRRLPARDRRVSNPGHSTRLPAARWGWGRRTLYNPKRFRCKLFFHHGAPQECVHKCKQASRSRSCSDVFPREDWLFVLQRSNRETAFTCAI